MMIYIKSDLDYESVSIIILIFKLKHYILSLPHTKGMVTII